MSQPVEPKPDQKRYLNNQHEQWLNLSATQLVIQVIESWAKLPTPTFTSAEEVELYKNTAIVRGAYQDVVDHMRIVPYPNVEEESKQLLLDEPINV